MSEMDDIQWDQSRQTHHKQHLNTLREPASSRIRSTPYPNPRHSCLCSHPHVFTTNCRCLSTHAHYSWLDTHLSIPTVRTEVLTESLCLDNYDYVSTSTAAKLYSILPLYCNNEDKDCTRVL